MAFVTNAGLIRVLDLLDADTDYIGLGTGTGVAVTDTLLTTETLRKASTNLIDGYTLLIEAYLDTTEGNGVTYTETGAFGDSATSSVDTGAMVAGGVISQAKTALISYTISYEITVSRA